MMGEWLRTGQVDIAFPSSTCREEFNHRVVPGAAAVHRRRTGRSRRTA